MSVLGSERIIELIKEKDLIVNLNPRDSEKMEGAGVDLRAGEIFEIVAGSKLGIENRTRPTYKSIKKFNEAEPEDFYKLKPGECIMVETVEIFNMPDSLTATVTGRRSLYGQGVVVASGNVPPGYNGKLSFCVINQGPVDFEFAMGSRDFFVVFDEVVGGVNPYAGQWQGGNLKSVKDEKQI